MSDANKVVELPTGQYDAVRTLRHLLQQAEKGEFTEVLVVCCNHSNPESDDIWATWSDMKTIDAWWMSGWLTSYLQRRYFSGNGLVDE